MGNKTTSIYLPAGYLENPQPEYDVTYLFDLGTFFNYEGQAKGPLDDVFTNHVHGQIVIGFGDYANEPGLAASENKDRTNMLTPVREI